MRGHWLDWLAQDTMSGGLLWKRYRTRRFLRMLGISWLDEKLLASQGFFTLIVTAAFAWMDCKKEKCTVSTVGLRTGFEYRTSGNDVCLCFSSLLVLRKAICLPICVIIVWQRIRNTAGHFSSWLLVSGGNVQWCRPAGRDGGGTGWTGRSRRGLTLGCE
jgi:hypothetical protein